MKNNFFILFIILGNTFLGYAQQFSATVLDDATRKPVPFTTVQYAANRGVITNDEGYFTINESKTQLNELTISSIGYETVIVPVSEIMNDVIYLKTEVIQLDDVFISNKKLSGREVLQLAKENVDVNYKNEVLKGRFFFRESSLNRVKNFDLEIEESTIPDIDQALMNKLSASVPRTSNSYKEVLGDFRGNYSKQKISLLKGANLYNPQNTASLEQLTNKMDQIFKENVKPDSYLKIKSGLLGVKVDVEEINQEWEEGKKKPTAEDIVKSEEKKKKALISSTNTHVASLLKETFWDEDGTFDLFNNLNKYQYAIKGYMNLDSKLVYVIDFEPKRGADFKGRIYVDTEDYGVHRIDYSNVKPLKKFRLFGVSTMDDVYRGKMIFRKEGSGKYYPKYLEREVGESFGIERPLTLIEKNKHVGGRRKQNELDMEIDVKVSQINKFQLVIFNNSQEDNTVWNEKNNENFEYRTFKKYDPDFWNGYNIIEPNAAIKEFTALDLE